MYNYLRKTSYLGPVDYNHFFISYNQSTHLFSDKLKLHIEGHKLIPLIEIIFIS